MSGHTPGPWKAKGANGKYDNRRNSWNVCDEEADCSEAAPITLNDGTVIGFAVHSEDGYYAGTRSDANAQLMAAAPDLLKACKLALARIRSLAPGEPDYLVDAIAKATGEAP